MASFRPHRPLRRVSPRACISYILDHGDVAVSIEPSFGHALHSANNAGERQLITELLRAMRETLAPREPQLTALLADAEISTAVDRFAPLGLKKKLIALPASRPELDPQDLPPFRAVQESEYEEILDGLGEALRAKGWPEGPIKDEDRDRVMNDVVSYLFGELQRLIAHQTPNFLRALIAYQEAITRELYSVRFSLPTRLLCFAQDPEMINRFTKEHSKASLANTANRFLIEYVAAQPPQGNANESLESYDRLIALAAEIAEMGMLSDYLHFQIIEGSLSILPSGRFGREHAALEAASEQFAKEHMSGEVDRSERLFTTHYETPKPPSGTIPTLAQALDNGFLQEWGITLTDLRRLQVRLYEIGTTQAGPMKTVSRTELTTWITQEWGWTVDKVGRAIEICSLGARADFFTYPGESRAEVYPWRFNRSLSHQRRPVILVGSADSTHLVWGNRHLTQSMRYLFDLCTTGRLKARSPSLAAVIARMRDLKSREFEKEVADIIRLQGHLVKTRFKKLGHLKMVGNHGEDLGDIDVLVIMESLKLVIPIECKAFELARTPREVQNELVELFKGTGHADSTMEKHLRRVQWLKNNLLSVLDALRVAGTGKWHVQPLLVSDEEMRSPYFLKSPIPVCSIDTLRRGNLRAAIKGARRGHK